MKPSIKFFLLAVLCLAVSASAKAQNAEMADAFRADGKIYVVVAIVLIVLSGLVLYLFMLDRKLSRLEKSMGTKKQTKPQGKSF